MVVLWLRLVKMFVRRINMNEIKLCINCNHNITHRGVKNICYKSEYTSPVDGAVNFMSCFTFRINSLNDYCGPDAKFFEPKDEVQK